MVMSVLLPSCNGDYAEPPLRSDYIPGSWDAPYSMTNVLDGIQAKNRWFHGYIVGWIDTSTPAGNVFNGTTATFSAPATLASNILLAASPDETSWFKCVAVQLPTGAVRSALNLMDNPDALGREVCVYGTVDTYFSVKTSLKPVTAFNWGAEGYDIPDTDSYILYAPFTDGSYAGFTLEGEVPVMDNGEKLRLWYLNGSYGLNVKGMDDATKVKYETDTWAVSPVVDLNGHSNVYWSLEWAGNYFTTQDNFKSCCQLGVREAGSPDWTLVEDVTYPAGNNWTFVNTGKISLDAWSGKKIQVGIHYMSSTALTGTLEITNLIINDGEAE